MACHPSPGTSKQASPVIRLEHLTKTYAAPAGVVHALDDVSLHVRQGEIFGIIGRSGAGKSTLIRALNLLERPTQGRVLVHGRDITALDEPALRDFRRGVGMVFQHFNLLRSRTVLDNVRFPLKLAGLPRQTQAERAREALALVGLAGQEDKYPSQLSGGQQQRVGIARALANGPQLLLCDEATSALDPETTQSILRLLRDINARLGLTIVLITHGMDVIRAVCDRVAVIEAGRIVESGDVLDVFLHPTHDVTRALLSESGIDAEGWRAMADSVGGRLLRLSFRGAATAQPMLSRASRELGVDLSILHGTVGRIKDVPYGQLVVAAQGQPDALARLPAWLDSIGIQHEVLRA